VADIPASALGRHRRRGFLYDGGTDAVPDELLLVPAGAETKTYSPKDRPDLFRKFANLDGSAESILDFANSNGRLVEEGTDGEPIVLWQGEIDHANRVLTAWDFLKGGATLTAAQVVRRVLKDEADSWDATRRTSTQLRRRLAQAIESTVNPSVFSYRTNSPSTVRFASSDALLLPLSLEWDDTRRLFMRQVQQPTSLLVLIWSQIIEALTGVRDFRKCAYAKCSVMIEVSRDSPSGRTARAEYHTDSCRALASRMRRPKPKHKRQLKG
jgi:hypothetical protein